MSGSPAYALGLVASALGAVVAGVPWLAVAALLAAVPYIAIGVLRTRELLRSRDSRGRLLLR